MRACRYANHPQYPCSVDLSKVDLGYHYSKNHNDKPTYDELLGEISDLKDKLAELSTPPPPAPRRLGRPQPPTLEDVKLYVKEQEARGHWIGNMLAKDHLMTKYRRDLVDWCADSIDEIRAFLVL